MIVKILLNKSMISALNLFIFILFFVQNICLILPYNIKCPNDQFIIPGMTNCHRLLTCEDVPQMKPIKLLAIGTVKNIWLFTWKKHLIVMSKLRSSELFEDFQSNFQNLLYFKENNNFTNLIGYCGTSIFTQYYSKGNGINLQSFFSLHQVNKFHDRFQYCIYYAEIIQILHENSMVMCDSNSVLKTMSQFLINDQFRFILNDLDALPRIDSSGIRCGHKQIFGDLVAPEQIWPYTDIPFNESIMPTYTEMIDIWKIPDICHWILGDVPIWSLSKQMLYHIHSQCKMIDPTLRPNINNIVNFYYLINDLSNIYLLHEK